MARQGYVRLELDLCSRWRWIRESTQREKEVIPRDLICGEPGWPFFRDIQQRFGEVDNLNFFG